ncbi:CCA tRNA nucleotidyltransferase [Sphingobium boeckii]|uniref:Poly(A) polymerase n=1 Tax=Sphingobium boeckii TaxID=1082345 RepID=A0A7W9AI03_9SPHN|nr:CCA tRNA nucleotidyltransferase [Sphingobium boeckii]MBB5686050.1 poly(A) polymerase [Sphingobium boeckii]
MGGLTLPDAPWRHREGLDRLFGALGDARFVGGAVRDTLLGVDVQDVDVATALRPETVVARLAEAGIKTVPTGIAHGTVTALLPGGPVEVTTLRQDVSTDGRRATVAFSDDWREDAARRDFTVNALYADPATGDILDYFDGVEDLAQGRVRFIGDAAQRIAEDHLRILRFFRFHARFGKGAPDADGLAACATRANDMMALSRERIADELLKLLGLPDPAPTLATMQTHAIFKPIVPEIGEAAVKRLATLIARESAAGAKPDALRRFIAILPPDRKIADGVAARLKLSKAIRKRVDTALADDGTSAEEMFYRWGMDAALDRLLLSNTPIEDALPRIHAIQNMPRPILPIGGGALVTRGLQAGPIVARALKQVEQQWIDEGFPGEERVSAIADQAVAQLLRETI